MKPNELNTEQWQNLLNEFRATLPTDERFETIAMRCENSQLTLGWRCGGFSMGGTELYISFSPLDAQGNRAMLAVRSDFLKWVTKRLKEIDEALKADAPKQGELGL